MRRRAVAGVASLVVAAGWMIGSAPSRADTVTATVGKVGWWTQQPGAQPAPDGGFQVANGPNGPLSQAAADVRVGVASGVTSTITLTEVQSVRSDAAGINICLASTPWVAANPGAFADAPQSDCSRTIPMTRDAGSTTWKADVGGLLAGGQTTSVYFLPAPQSAAPGVAVDPGWQVNITKMAVSSSGTTTQDTFTTDASSTSSVGSTSSSGSSSFSTPSAATGSSFTPSIDSSVTPAVPASTPPVEPAPTPTAAPSEATVTVHRPGEHKPWIRLLLFVPLAAIVGAGSTFARRQLAAT